MCSCSVHIVNLKCNYCYIYLNHVIVIVIELREWMNLENGVYAQVETYQVLKK